LKPSLHSLWLVGFRPFFVLAMLSGLALPVLWALTFDGVVAVPQLPVLALQWHAHEMFFGFGWAVLGGFLLTATKNWVQIRGYHGPVLMFLAAAWIFERIGMAFGGGWPGPLFLLSNNLFLATIVVLLLWTLIRHRSRDTFCDNYFFLLVLPAFLVAKALLLSAGHFEAGWGMTLALFRMAFLVMLERTLTQFMKGVFQASILRDARLDGAIKLLGLALVFAAFMPPPMACAVAILLAFMLTARFAFWKPQLALRRLDIGIMYLGYLAIVAQLLAEAAGRLVQVPWAGAVSVHLFAFGVMGLIIPAMLVRIAKGHTGRKVVFEPADKAVLYLMMLGLVMRVLAPQLLPSAYVEWIYGAAACWFAGFALLAWRYMPMLVQPRIDGKEH
jgi:uncharacterized protein involved in response to NO